MKSLVTIIVSLFIGVYMIMAQVQGSCLSGKIIDPNKEAVAKATVTISDLVQGKRKRPVKFITSEDGSYEIRNLKPSTYRITVEASGFKTKITEITVNKGENATADIELEVSPLCCSE